VEILITGRHVDVTPELDRYIRSRVEKLARFDEMFFGTKVTLTTTGDSFVVEMNVGLRKGVILAAHAEADDITSCINIVEARVESQLRKYKERIQSHRKMKRQGVIEVVENLTPVPEG